MSDIEAIAALCQQVDNLLENLRDQAEEDQERNRIAYQQKLNEQACFVLAWGQLEAEKDKACRNAIRLGKSHEEWQYRRAWSLCDSENPRLSFRNRMTLVLDQSKEEWKRTMEYYEVRNQIAHGNLRSEEINILRVIDDFNDILSSLARN